MADLTELDSRIAALEEAIKTVAAGRSVQWGDRLVTMEQLPNLEAALANARKERSTLLRRAAGDRSSARYRTASFS